MEPVTQRLIYLTEAQFEPGSNDLVLKNRLGIMSPQEMDVAEARALERAMNSFIGSYGESHRFMVADLFALHKDWLSEIYDWAGQYRQVNISKDGFPFAAAAQVPRLMALFERDVLQRNTPCTFKDQAEVIRTLAETHMWSLC
jgi:cell filamentation protein